jgi:hypothetical protein
VSNELEIISAHVEAMRRAYGEIESARTIDEVKDIRDRAEAARQYAKAAGYSREITNMCAEIKIRAERKAGTLLAEMPKQTGGDATRARLQGATELPPSYKDLGIEKTQAHRWQQSAAIPDDVVDDYIQSANEAQGDVTNAGLRLHAARQRKPDPVTEPVPLPDGKFSCIVADPPWSMRLIEREQRPDQGGLPRQLAPGVLPGRPSAWCRTQERRTGVRRPGVVAELPQFQLGRQDAADALGMVCPWLRRHHRGPHAAVPVLWLQMAHARSRLAPPAYRGDGTT